MTRPDTNYEDDYYCLPDVSGSCIPEEGFEEG